MQCANRFLPCRRSRKWYTASSEFDFQFLDAIRDVERDMLTGRNTLLREVIDFFLDYDIKHNPDKTREQKIDEIPTEEDIKSANTPDDKLEMMKKLLANSKVAENIKQKKIYSAMANIVVVRNY